MNRPYTSLPSMSLLYLGGFMLLILFQSIDAQAEIYYVATTGSDSNPGTLDQPWRHPQKCVDPSSPLEAGDSCLIGDGTYTDTDGNGIVVYIRPSAPRGTAEQPITLKSQNPLGAVIALPSTSGTNTGIYIASSYYVIEGFDVSGGAGSGEATSTSGITVAAGITNVTIRQNDIHGQGVGACTNSVFGNSALFFDLNASNITLENNTIHHIGRLRNGENNCSTERYNKDHGIYSGGATNVTIQRNIFFDITRGYPLHIYRGGGATHANIFFHNNTLSGKSPTGYPPGQVLLCNTLENVHIKNNIFHDLPLDYAIHYCAITPKVKGLVISHNLTNGTRNDFQNPNSKPLSGVTYLNNRVSVDPRFTDADSRDYRLRSTSPAINTGTNVGLPYKGSAPDIGAYEFSEQEDTKPRPTVLSIQ